jgi:hypothetical protein
MSLAPINASPLQGLASNRGKSLTVTDPNGNVVVEAAQIKTLDGDGVVVETAGGRWWIEQADRSAVTVLDSAGQAVATVQKGEVIRADSGTLSWEQRGLPSRYQLGGDLWVAKGGWRSGRRFSAELSRAMLGRDDMNLLIGIAAILTQHAMARHGNLLGAGAAFGAMWG